MAAWGEVVLSGGGVVHWMVVVVVGVGESWWMVVGSAELCRVMINGGE